MLRRILQCEHPLAGEAAVVGRFRGGGELSLAEAIQFGPVLDDHRRRVDSREQLVGERRDEPGLFLIERAQCRLIGLGDFGPGAQELAVVALEQIRRLRIQPECRAPVVERSHTRVERRVHEDCVPVRGQLGRLFGPNPLERGIGIGVDEAEEDP